MALTGKLTKKLVENLGAGRHGDGGGLYLVVDPSGARRWIVRVVVKGQRNAQGAPLRTDFGLGGADVVTLNQARERALEYRRMAKAGLNPRFNAMREIPCFEEIARQVHIERLPTWKNPKHGDQWINTLRDYAFQKIGRMPVDSIGQPEVLMCLSPIWTDKHETARRVAQRIATVLDVAKSKGFRSGENPVTAIQDAQVLPKVKAKPKHHSAMAWKEVPAFYADLKTRDAMAAKALSGAKDLDVLRAIWKTYRGVVHLGMAMDYCDEQPDSERNVLHVAETYRRGLSLFCPKGTKKPYVPVDDQITFLYLSYTSGPRFLDRGLPFAVT
jgi:integrase